MTRRSTSTSSFGVGRREKVCSRCGVEKSLDEFPVRRASADGRGYLCKPCNSAHVAEWKQLQPPRPPRLVGDPIVCLIVRLMRKVVPDGECWRWTGAMTRGYASARRFGKVTYVHIVLWEMLNGPVPAGLNLDHLCRHTWCVRPDHLEAVTPGENVRRGFAARRRERAEREGIAV